MAPPLVGSARQQQLLLLLANTGSRGGLLAAAAYAYSAYTIGAANAKQTPHQNDVAVYVHTLRGRRYVSTARRRVSVSFTYRP